MPYERVWGAAIAAVRDYAVTRAADQTIETDWTERGSQPGFDRVQERVFIRVEPFGVRITRVSVDVQARGWRDGIWVPIVETEDREHGVLDRIRDLQN